MTLPPGPTSSPLAQTLRWAFRPFGGGVRRCLGASFAEFEMRIALREVLTRCDLHKANPAPERVGRRNTSAVRSGAP